jgi:hypothetical protein
LGTIVDRCVLFVEFFTLRVLVGGNKGYDSEELAYRKENFLLGKLEGVDVAIVVNF